MPTTYDTAPKEVVAVLQSAMEKHYPELVANELRIEILMATNPNGNPVKRAGSPVVAKIATVKPEERCRPKAPDERIKVDAVRYSRMSADSREAMFAGELEYIVLAEDKYGEIVMDNHNRPVTRHKQPDYLMAGFRRVHGLYQSHSLEQIGYDKVGEILGQKTFGFMGGGGGTPPSEPTADTSTVTLSSGGTSVTLDGAAFDRIGEAIERRRGGAVASDPGDEADDEPGRPFDPDTDDIDGGEGDYESEDDDDDSEIDDTDTTEFVPEPAAESATMPMSGKRRRGHGGAA